MLAEPALTNIGIVLPEPGFHDALRELTRGYGTLLAIDETHTICADPGGYTGAYDLEPDLLTIGKPIGRGIPAAAYGLSEDGRVAHFRKASRGGVGRRRSRRHPRRQRVSLTAMRATLSEVLTDEAFTHMIAMGERFKKGVAGVIEGHGLPWHVVRLGCRAEYLFHPGPA